MKGTVPSNNGPEINSVTPMGSELGGSRPGNASGNGSIIRTSAAMLGLAIAQASSFQREVKLLLNLQ